MSQWIGRVAAVTGASTGIGAEISAQLVKSGLKVVGLARRVDRLQKLKDDLSKFGEYHPVQCDVTKEETIVKAFNWIDDNLGGVDILVNNAGILKNSSLTRGKTEDWKQVFDTNVLGLCIASRQAIASMEKRNVAGYVIHINSIAGHQIHPQVAPVLNVYVASKHAVTALTETLRLELLTKNSDIRVSSVSPGAVRSDILEASQLQNSSFVNEINNCVLQPIDIANAVLYLLSTPPSVNVTELTIMPLKGTT
ncbi:farnesol dehydrogenase-like [Chrysoperla carnea]|uniref:farnesol dehydrogenase-like n=1 Tax=Chrysoperla carnea TaxID=189513 RepID=UPI001D084E63|nr:farnesol dehydrogenase-like [Chrysoperla carnea]